MSQSGGVDPYKRGKMVGLAILVSLLIFGLKIVQFGDYAPTYAVFFRAGVVGLVAYIGLLWALRFQVNSRTLFLVLSQAAFFIFSQTLFVEVFLFRKVERIYEVLILLSTVIILSVLNYVAFATANIFNVARIKPIPLVQVGKTTSFLLSLISIYFFTYSIFESQLFAPFYIVFPIIMYIVATILHLRHLEIPRDRIWKVVTLIVVMMSISIVLHLVIGGSTTITALTPAIIFYCMVNIFTIENISTIKIIEYLFITFGSFAANFLSAV